jgi:hypothetical protein
LPDEWETANGLNPRDGSDALLDSDNDGMSNAQEFLAGTDPRSAASTFKAIVRPSTTGNLMLEFTAAPSRSYTIEFRDALGAGAWQKLTEIAAAPAEHVQQTTLSTNGSTRFYRIVISPPQ